MEKIFPAFADIFRNNTTKNGMLAIELTENEVDEIFRLVDANPGITATVDLQAQQIVLNSSQPRTFDFEVNEGTKKQLLEGKDDIDLTLKYEKEIRAFEKGFDPLNPSCIKG
jgi:3-isopropylmalate/(R)-2-methylmalate dehydratase small subunit